MDTSTECSGQYLTQGETSLKDSAGMRPEIFPSHKPETDHQKTVSGKKVLNRGLTH